MEKTGESSTAKKTRTVSFSEALRFWIKLGFISFGGPAGQIAIMHKELVERRRWLGEERFLHALNYCMLLPGPEAHQLAIYIGWLMHRTWGGIAAGFFFVFPAIFILLILSYIYAAHGNVLLVAGILEGFKPIVVAIVVEALLKISSRALKRRVDYFMAATAFVCIYFLSVPFPLIVFGAGIIGLAGIKYLPTIFSAPTVKKKEIKDNSNDESLPLVIDDHHAPPVYTKPSQIRFLKTLTVGFILWLLPFAALISWQGWNSLHAQEYRFFTQSALVTFGGAYAVLAYVSQAVTAAPYNWLTGTQAIDGLALAETTPGPLIMVLQFVGFMAGWNNVLAGMNQITSAVFGAVIAAYTTFLPSFLFIFAGAPYIEFLRGNKNLTGALSGITAAVVGVILNLVLVFGIAVIFPGKSMGSANGFAAIMSIAAFIALFRFKLDVLWIILIGGASGLIIKILTG